MADVTRLAIGVRNTNRGVALEGYVESIDIYPALSDPQLSLVTAGPDAIVVWGDSLMGTTGASSADTSWPYLLRTELGAGVDGLGKPRCIINRSVGGNTSPQILTRFLAEPHLWQFTSFFNAGQNDGAGGEDTLANLRSMVSRLPHSRFGVMTVPVLPGDGAGGNFTRKNALNTAILAAFPDNVIDWHAHLRAFGGDGGGTDTSNIAAGHVPTSALADGTHHSDKGHKLDKEIARTFVEQRGWTNVFQGAAAA